MPGARTLRLGVAVACALAVLVAGEGGAGWVAPTYAQGTVPGGGQSVSEARAGGTLSAGTGTIVYGANACLGRCAAIPRLDSVARQSAPAGLRAGLKFDVVSVGGRRIPRTTVCFLGATVSRPAIRYYDPALNRWVRIWRTFSRGDLFCYTGRIVGNIGLFEE